MIGWLFRESLEARMWAKTLLKRGYRDIDASGSRDTPYSVELKRIEAFPSGIAIPIFEGLLYFKIGVDIVKLGPGYLDIIVEGRQKMTKRVVFVQHVR